MALLDRYMEGLRARIGIDCAPTTLSSYVYTHRTLGKFIEKKFKTKDIAFGRLNEQFIREYQDYTLGELGYSMDTVHHYLAILTKICKIAFKDGISEKFHFAHYKLPKQKEATPKALSRESFEKIRDLEIPERCFSTHFTRDLFLFACYTGTAYADVIRITKENLFTDEEGSLWLKYARKKTDYRARVKLLLYWVMSGDEFTLDINNPTDPKILVVGNNPDRQNIYGAALGLYNSRIVKLINKKGQLKSSVIIDELPTIYFKSLDNLIATARSNKVAVLLDFQDFSQLKRDYGDKEAAVVMNTVGNIFSGQVVGDTAKTLSDRFGKVLQKRQSMTINHNDKSTSISTQMDSLIPPSKISNLTQGMFIGAIADNFDERIEQKIFHA